MSKPADCRRVIQTRIMRSQIETGTTRRYLDAKIISYFSIKILRDDICYTQKKDLKLRHNFLCKREYCNLLRKILVLIKFVLMQSKNNTCININSNDYNILAYV